jgi:hypothetical protein
MCISRIIRVAFLSVAWSPWAGFLMTPRWRSALLDDLRSAASKSWWRHRHLNCAEVIAMRVSYGFPGADQAILVSTGVVWNSNFVIIIGCISQTLLDSVRWMLEHVWEECRWTPVCQSSALSEWSPYAWVLCTRGFPQTKDACRCVDLHQKFIRCTKVYARTLYDRGMQFY